MTNELTTTNSVNLEGTVVQAPEFSHELFGEKFYIFPLNVPRTSGVSDKIIITLSERLMPDISLSVGDKVKVDGQIRTYNKEIEGKSRLFLNVFVKTIENISEISNYPNSVVIIGHICKPPVYRTTPFGREICDTLIATNRQFSKSDYIPAIVWGRNAKFASRFKVGEHVEFSGRLQSREYDKKHTDGKIEHRTAFEVSVSKMRILIDEDEQVD